VLGVAAFLVGVNYWDKLIYPRTTGFELKWFVSLILAPVIGLYVLWLGRIQRMLGWALTGVGSLATLVLVASEFFGPDNLVNDQLGFHIRGIALQFADNGGRAKDVIAQSSDKLANALTFDSAVVIPIYLLAFGGFGVWISTRLTTKVRWFGGVICGLAIGAASADFVENDRIATLLKVVIDKGAASVIDKNAASAIDQAAWSVTQASSLKWTVLALMLLSVGVATVGLVWESLVEIKLEIDKQLNQRRLVSGETSKDQKLRDHEIRDGTAERTLQKGSYKQLSGKYWELGSTKKEVSMWLAGLLTAACGLAAGSLGLWSVHALSHWIEWSLVGLALCMALMGQTIIQATRERSLANPSSDETEAHRDLCKPEMKTTA
jgi:hypothetical protein